MQHCDIQPDFQRGVSVFLQLLIGSQGIFLIAGIPGRFRLTNICGRQLSGQRVVISIGELFNALIQEIYYVQFGNTSTGSEQHGDRPAVIIQNDVGNTYAPTLIVVPLTSNTEKKVTQPTHCLLENEGLSMSSMALAEQIFTIDKSRILKYLGHLAPEDMQRLDYALKNSLALNPLGSIRKLKPIIRSTAAYAPPEVVDGKPPVYPYTPIQSSFEDAGSVEEMMLYTELQSAVHAMIQRLEYSFTFNPSLLTIPKRKQQVSEILAEAEKYIWRIREEMQCD